MTSKEKLHGAFAATRALGIPDEEVKPVLKQLLRLYDKKWELIEQENYRTLVDAYFDLKDKGADATMKNDLGHDSIERPSKKLNSGKQDEDQVSSTNGNPSHKLKGKRQPENSRGGLMKVSPSCPRIREDGCSSQPPQTQISDKKKDPVLSHDTEGKRNLMPEKEFDINLLEDSGSAHSSNKIISNFHEPELDNMVVKKQPVCHESKKYFHFLADIARGSEHVKISLVDEFGDESLPNFNYIPHNIIYDNAQVRISLACIPDSMCCPNCSGNCLSSVYPCACSHDTGGEFAYTPKGVLKEEFLGACISTALEPKEHELSYCQDCPIERSKNEDMPDQCKGHVVRKFIKECWRKCGCDMQCGNRIVQRGITCELQVFSTPAGKGWGVRTLEDLPKGTFVCEYVGEILTNTELYERNTKTAGKGRHTYPVTLDADWASERILRDDDALCLDATFYGNVARFINHRCVDANLIDIPVQIETPDRHYYHLAFFTTREVAAFEELTWDYNIDFNDHSHPVKAFRCRCQSTQCRDNKRRGAKSKRL